MGKYMRKAKITREVAVMELAAPQSSSVGVGVGVKTRAKTLALQRLQKTQISDSSAYLQLRSRRLEKRIAPLICGGGGGGKESPKVGCGQRGDLKANSKGVVGNSRSEGSVEARKEAALEEESVALPRSFNDLGVQASFGENVLEIEGRDRSTRETTPCSLIQSSDTVVTPGSTTRPTNSSATNRRIQSGTRRNIPTSQELEELFASGEQEEIRIFTEKYNFDPVTESPLPGRFEWERVSP